MKMTKMESAGIIEKRKGDCRGIKCVDCFRVNFCDNEGIETGERMKRQTADAAAYIKRHESKTKKPAVKTDVRDMANVVKDETVKESLKVDPTPLDIAKMIRDNKYNCNLDFFECSKCPLKPQYFHCLKDRKTLIDTYISDHIEDKSGKVEHEIFVPARNVGKAFMKNNEKAIKELQRLFGLGEVKIDVDWGLSKLDLLKKAEPVMPEPLTIEELRACMKIDMWVYYFNDKVARINLKNIHTISANRSEISLISTAEISNATDYYKTLADAVRVAEEKWGVK